MKGLLEVYRAQVRSVLAFEARDVPKRVGTAAIICATLGYFGAIEAASTLFLVIMCFELLGRYLLLTTPEDDDEVSELRATVMLVFYAFTTAAFCTPGIALVQQDSFAAVICGVLWINGVGIHCLGAHALIKFFTWVSLTPVMLLMSVALMRVPGTAYPPMTTGEQYLMTLTAFLWVANIFETNLRQAGARRDFINARLDAQKRLKQLDYLARHDALTGLLNRRAFDEAVADALLLDTGPIPALLMIDLDGFKPVNDKFGHAAGDAILVELATRIRSVVSVGSAARLGGDEFAVLVGTIDNAWLLELAKEIRQACSEPVDFEGHAVSVGASVGIATARSNDTIESFSARADRAMYAAKACDTRRPVFDADDLARAS